MGSIWPERPPSSSCPATHHTACSPRPQNQPIHNSYLKRVTQGRVPNAVINSEQYILHAQQLILTSVNRFTEIRANIWSQSSKEFYLFGALMSLSLKQGKTGCIQSPCHSSSSWFLLVSTISQPLLIFSLCVSIFAEVFTSYFSFGCTYWKKLMALNISRWH